MVLHASWTSATPLITAERYPFLPISAVVQRLSSSHAFTRRLVDKALDQPRKKCATSSQGHIRSVESGQVEKTAYVPMIHYSDGFLQPSNSYCTPSVYPTSSLHTTDEPRFRIRRRCKVSPFNHLKTSPLFS